VPFEQQNLETLFSDEEGTIQLTRFFTFIFLLYRFKLVFFIIEFDVFILLVVDHLKMKKISTTRVV